MAQPKNGIIDVAASTPDDTPDQDIRDDGDRSEERLRRIHEAAYRRAEARGFTPGEELEDWLSAERDIDADGSADRGLPPP